MFRYVLQSAQRLTHQMPRSKPRTRRDLGLLATMATMGCMASVQFSSKAQCQEACPVSKKLVEQANEVAEPSQPPKGVCPVAHTSSDKQPSDKLDKRCPVQHTQMAQPASNPGAGSVCPVKAGSAGSGGEFARMASKMKQNASAVVTSGTHGAYEPLDSDEERYVAPYDPAKAQAEEEAAQGSFTGIHNAHIIPGGRIPATGRGNSDDGSDWVNPTPAELFRALRRKNKPIEEEDAWSVAFVHSVVVDQTWAQIMEYEDLHKDECAEPTLASFEGKYGEDSVKTKLLNLFYPSMVPFDRHDWYIDRCGKRIRYIIDYYAVEDEEGNEVYTVDARPEPTFQGAYDRLIVAGKRWWRGDSVW